MRFRRSVLGLSAAAFLLTAIATGCSAQPQDDGSSIGQRIEASDDSSGDSDQCSDVTGDDTSDECSDAAGDSGGMDDVTDGPSGDTDSSGGSDMGLQNLKLAGMTIPKLPINRPAPGSRPKTGPGVVAACEAVCEGFIDNVPIPFLGIKSQREQCKTACRILHCYTCNEAYSLCAAHLKCGAKKASESCLVVYNTFCAGQ